MLKCDCNCHEWIWFTHFFGRAQEIRGAHEDDNQGSGDDDDDDDNDNDDDEDENEDEDEDDNDDGNDDDDNDHNDVDDAETVSTSVPGDRGGPTSGRPPVSTSTLRPG